jgi:competence CoiA-like predicted nuclease
VDKAIGKVDKAIEQLEKKKGKLSEEDWKAIESEVEEPLKVIANALDNNTVGAMGKIKILAVTAKWAAALTEAGISELEKKTGVDRENFSKELDKVAKELEKAIKEQNQ